MTNPEMIAMIQAQQSNVVLACRPFGLNRSSFYEQTTRKPSQTKQRHKALAVQIQAFYEASKMIYGAPKVHHELI